MNRKTFWTVAGLAYALITTSMVLGAGKPATPWKIPFFKARAKNPVPADAKSISAGKEVYTHNCESCHGTHGRGDGPKAADLEVSPGDLTKPDVAKQSDGELYWKITEGRKPMPSHEKLITEQQRWEVVNYLRTLSVRPPQFEAPAACRQAISAVIAPYLKLGQTLADGNTQGAQADVSAAAAKLAAAETKGLNDDAKTAWKTMTQQVTTTAGTIKSAQDIVSLRKAYKDLSDALIQAVKQFGYDAKVGSLQRFFCPTAFEKVGASWLQTPGDVHNPYLAPDEPACGSSVEVYSAGKSL